MCSFYESNNMRREITLIGDTGRRLSRDELVLLLGSNGKSVKDLLDLYNVQPCGLDGTYLWDDVMAAEAQYNRDGRPSQELLSKRATAARKVRAEAARREPESDDE